MRTWWGKWALLFVLIRSTTALRHRLKIIDDPRQSFLIESFGFYAGGNLDLTLTNFHVSPSPPATYRVGIAVTKTASEGTALQEVEQALYSRTSTCALDTLDISGGGFVLDLTDVKLWPQASLHKEIESGEQGLYSLVFASCGGEPGAEVSFGLEAVFMNPDGQYLSAGDEPLSKLFLTFAILFGIALILWVRILQANREAVHSVHHMMAALVMFKVLSLFAESLRFHFLAISGSSEAWSIVYYAFAFIKGVSLFVVILLIGMGWSLIKPCLNQSEKKILLIVGSLQVLDNIALVVLDETSPGSRSWLAWRDVLHAVDLLCCVAILIPIVGSIKHLKQTTMEGAANDKAAITLGRLTRFRHFYIMVFLYVYMTRVVVYLMGETLPFDLQWIQQFFTELATLVFFLGTGVKFHPSGDSPYSSLKNGDLDEYGEDRLVGRSGDGDSDDEIELARFDNHSRGRVEL